MRRSKMAFISVANKSSASSPSLARDSTYGYEASNIGISANFKEVIIKITALEARPVHG
jgi:hypothetical protein